MALPDRTDGARTAVFDFGSGLDDIASNATITVTGTPAYIDPIVSGTARAAFLSSDSVSIPTQALDSRLSATISSYLHFPDATGTLASFDGSDISQTAFIQYNAAGYLTITLPYLGFPQVRINYVPIDTTQIVVAMSTSEYAIFVNGWQYESGAGATFANVETLIYGGAADVTLGAAIVYDRKLELPDVEAEIVEAVSANSTANVYTHESMSFSDSNQVYATKFDVPRSYDWEEFDSQATGVRYGLYGLDLRVIESYVDDLVAYEIDDISEYTNGSSGQIYVYIPTYQTSATVRGAVYLKRKNGIAADEHVIIFDSNAVKYVHREFTVTNGTQSFVETTSASLGTASGAVSVGFEWDGTDLYVRLNNSTTAVQTDYNFSPYDVYAQFGVDHNDNSYHSSKSEWDWQIRTSETPETTPGATTYGEHSYDTAEDGVYAEGSVKIVVPHADDNVRKPYYEIDGKHIITEALD